MIYKLLSCFTVISASVYANEVKEKFAVSTQSFDRPDIPISYKFTNVHNNQRDNKPEREHSEHRHLESAPKRYPVIQYAPLNYDIRTEEHHNEEKVRPKELNSVSASVNTGRHVYTGHEKSKYEHLEPKPLKESHNVNQQKYRSFISGHNVEAYETTGHDLEQGVDTFLNHQDYMEKAQQTKTQKAKPPKFVYYQKTKDDPVLNLRKNNVIEEAPENIYNYLEFHPASFSSARRANKKSLPYAYYSLHNLLAQEKQLQTYAHPRIHLNIARSYNIANQPAEAQLPLGLAAKPLTITNLILHPQNTLMFPRKVNSDTLNSFS